MISWRELNEKCNTFTEAELTELLNAEVTTHKRMMVLKRLHQRMGTLRQQREWEFMMELVK